MDRRDFLKNIFASAAGLTLDPDKLLWVPGAKKIFIPPKQRMLVLVVNYYSGLPGRGKSHWYTDRHPVTGVSAEDLYNAHRKADAEALLRCWNAELTVTEFSIAFDEAAAVPEDYYEKIKTVEFEFKRKMLL